MNRRLIALLLVTLLAILPLALTSAAESKIFAIRGLGDRYIGIESYTSVQDPAMPTGALWAAGPVGLTMWPSGSSLVEGGTVKVRNPQTNQWGRYPFYTFRAADGTFEHTRFYNTSFNPATYVKYTIRQIGGNQSYKVIVCFGTSFQYCSDLLPSTNLGKFYFSHAINGAEGLCQSVIGERECPLGYIATTQNRFLSWYDNTWRTYCYTQSYNYTNGGMLSSCGPYPQPNWHVNFK